MKRRYAEIVALCLALAALIVIAVLQQPRGNVSTYSTYDGGPNGYRALYGVLAREEVPVRRLEARLAFLPRTAGVVAITETSPERGAGMSSNALDSTEVRQLQLFAKHGRILVFAQRGSALAAALRKFSTRFDPAPYTNSGLARDPAKAGAIFDAVAGRGEVFFDERIHGYVQDTSFWAALPNPVRAAAWIVAAILLLQILDRNVRALPAVSLEPAQDRDSSSYIRSVASMLRRGRAGRAAIARFADDAVRLHARSQHAETQAALEELQQLAQRRNPGEGAVLHAARLYATIRKEG